MFRALSSLFGSLKVLLGWTASSVEESIPLRERLAADRRDQVDEFKHTLELAEEVGAGTKLLTQDVQAARVACQRLESALQGLIAQAKKAAERGDRDAEGMANAQSFQIAQEFARTKEALVDLEVQLEESEMTRNWSKDVVIAKALRLAQLKREDTQLVARTSANELRRSALRLQEEMLALVPEDDGDLRARAKDNLRIAEAKVSARRDLVSTLKLVGPNNADILGEEEGAKILEQAQRDAGYVPSVESVPALTDGKSS